MFRKFGCVYDEYFVEFAICLIIVFNVTLLVLNLSVKMADRDESKKYKKKKQHTKHYYYYTPDDYVSEEEYTPCEYYTPRLSREAGLVLYERASAAQKRLEGILKEETKQKIQCVKEMGRINGHLIAENQHVCIVYNGFWLRLCYLLLENSYLNAVFHLICIFSCTIVPKIGTRLF